MVQVELTRNFGIFDDVRGQQSWYVPGANVTWWVNGQEQGAFRLSNDTTLAAKARALYVYPLTTPLRASQQCEIRVTHPDFEAVRADQVMPGLIQAGDARLNRNVATDPFGGGETHEVSLTIQDRPGEKNYYEFSLRGIERYVTGTIVNGQFVFDTLEYERTYRFDQNADPNLQEGANGSSLLTDQFFDGQSYKLVGRFTQYNSSGDSTAYTLVVRRCTEAYYRWSLSYAKQYNTQDNPFSEPVPVFTNIENGLGVFGLFSERRFEVK